MNNEKQEYEYRDYFVIVYEEKYWSQTTETWVEDLQEATVFKGLDAPTRQIAKMEIKATIKKIKQTNPDKLDEFVLKWDSEKEINLLTDENKSVVLDRIKECKEIISLELELNPVQIAIEKKIEFRYGEGYYLVIAVYNRCLINEKADRFLGATLSEALIELMKVLTS